MNSLPGDQEHTQPDCIVLGPEPGVTPSSKPPVRIFLGTQPEQYRPERVFFWSIEKVRDPSRVYEIYLMSRMSGYRGAWAWNTGFTNYRFAIPYYAGYQGRAIYNDVDQTYHADPAELFDMDMGGHAVLAVSRTDTSVMLMDCERMKKYWTIEKVQVGRKYPLIAAVQADEGAYGPLDETWNVRDTPHVPGRTKCYHYTILHYQPWRPLRERFYYRPNEHGGALWYGLEESADKAGFQVYSASRPSRHFDRFLDSDAKLSEQNFAPTILADLTEDMITRTSAASVVEFRGSCSRDSGERDINSPVRPQQRQLGEVVRQMRVNKTPPRHDGIVLSAALSQWPREDLPWILDAIFAQANHFVVGTVHVPEAAEGRKASRRMALAKTAEWWNWAMGAAATRHPQVTWCLALAPRLDSGVDELEFCRGGAHPGKEEPTVWVLSDEKPGHTTQSLGLAKKLDWPYVEKKLRFNPRGELPNSMVKGSIASLRESSDPVVGPPWPDLVIATGRRTVPIAEWLRQHSLGRTRTVQMGRIGTSRDDNFDVGVAPAYAGLYPDPRRLETATPLTRVCQKSLDEATVQWRSVFGQKTTGPMVALLVGGTNAEHEFTSACARDLGESVRSMVESVGGRVVVSTSRRTSKTAAEALLTALGDSCAHSYVWQRDSESQENPYMGYLSMADAFVVTGESASMLAEACATHKPVAIFPLPMRSAGIRAWVRSLGRKLGDSVAQCAYSRPENKRGIERPQRRVQRFCAGLLAKGLVRTGGHSKRLHESLVSRGLAVFFDGQMPKPPTECVNEVERVADRVRAMMKYSHCAHVGEAAREDIGKATQVADES